MSFFLLNNERRQVITNGEKHVKEKYICQESNWYFIHSGEIRNEIQYQAQAQLLKAGKFQFNFHKRIGDPYKEKRVQIPELLNFPGIPQKVEIVDRFPICINIALKHKLHGDLNTAPNKEWIKYEAKPVFDKVFKAFLS